MVDEEKVNKETQITSDQLVVEEDGWDPANLAATIVIIIVSIGLLFWLFWSLMMVSSLIANIIAAIILLILVGEIVYIFKK